VDVKDEPDRESRGDEQQALEEIRQLFARYRQIARHGMVTEQYAPAERQDAESEEGLTRR
jgi:hypothetical protein